MRTRVQALAVAALLAVALASCGTSVFELEAGECFDDPDSFEAVSDVTTVSCDEPHDNQVFAIESISGPSNYPGWDLVAAESDEVCLDAFEPFVGTDYLSSMFEIGWLAPTADSWADGDRGVVCFLYDPTLAPITGSVEGSGR